ncbi:hypothetical protein FUAX_18040 [Fulvitalea axinellae]|uniref:Uncharacterized protein n=1 Tax=Fulvitalea axinellae TaxID=1182444 RepID=A0AAU9CN61_9BACT|nr:hypothetical protein FUAX_18040 [Fulvitalea axinellae]
MELEKELERIVERGKWDGGIKFLTEIGAEGRKAIAKKAKALAKDYNRYDNNLYDGYKGSVYQRRLLSGIVFTCLTERDFSKFSTVFLKQEEIGELLAITPTNWFSDYLNRFAEREEGYVPLGIKYDWLLEMSRKGWLSPSKMLWARCLDRWSPIYRDNEFFMRQSVEMLTKYDETLAEHIWYFFDTPSEFYYAVVDWTPGKANESVWLTVFKELVNLGLVDRVRLMRECLKGTIQGFNKPQTGWYMHCFEAMNPTEKDVLELSGEMMSALSSPQSKVPNTILKFFKKHCSVSGFDHEAFLDYASMLLNHETKSVVNSALMILDKQLKLHVDGFDRIALTVAEALSHTDASVQVRASKILKKCAGKTDDIPSVIAPYSESLVYEAKELLSDYLEENEPENVEVWDETEPVESPIRKESILESPKDIEALTFLLTQVFEHNDDSHFDLALDGVVRLDQDWADSDVSVLGPVLQKAYKVASTPWEQKIGHTNYLFALFFLEYSDRLIDRFPEGAKGLLKIRDKFYKEKQRWKSEKTLESGAYRFRTWQTDGKLSYSSVYFLFKQRLVEALELIDVKLNLPLLSTPTNDPHWVDPRALAGKLKLWQIAEAKPKHWDAQLAMSRVVLEGAESILPYIEEGLTGEWRDLLLFLFDKEALPKGEINNEAHWWTAGVTKAPETEFKAFENFKMANSDRKLYSGDYDWRMKDDFVKEWGWDAKLKKYRELEIPKTSLEIDIPEHRVRLDQSLLAKKMPEISVYPLLYVNNRWHNGLPKDISRILGLAPYRSELVAGTLLAQYSRFPEPEGEDDKRIMQRLVDFYNDHPCEMGEMGHLCVAAGLVNSDKTTRALASEVWIRQTQRGLCDSESLGKMLGTMYSRNFAPMKRLTDTLTQQLLHMSPWLDLRLQTVLENALAKLPNDPVRGLKKLLEQYQELLRKNKSSVPETLNGKLDAWAETKSLAKTVKSLMAMA